MLSQSGDVSSGWRVSWRFAILLLIPVGLIVCLLYAAQSEEEAIHARNSRWLAQMATQITNRVQIQWNFVRDRVLGSGAGRRAGQNADRGSTGDSGRQTREAKYSIATLQPAACGPVGSRNFAVVDEGAERWLYLQYSGKRSECARSDLKPLVEAAIRKGTFTSVLLAERSGRVLYQTGPESLRITDVGSCSAATFPSSTSLAFVCGIHNCGCPPRQRRSTRR